MTRALFVLTLLATAAPAGDWPQWLGPKRDNASPDTVRPWAEPPKTLWTGKVGPGFSTPVVAGGTVFVHARVKGKDAEEVVAFAAADG